MNGRRAIAISLLSIGGLAAVVGVVKVLDAIGDSAPNAGGLPVSAILPQAKPASAPFQGLSELRLGVGGKCLHVVVADTLVQRVAGLRGRRDLGPYDGMLFVFQGPSEAAFTMSGVPVDLDIGFYASDGSRNSARLMKPCPKAEAACPVYRSDGPFVYALETLRGQLPGGGVAACEPS
jgi:uncharacterized membrane protein (UPF0127 family)